MSVAPARPPSRLTSLLARRIRTRSLELNVTTHCNLKCYGCGRGSPAFDEEFVGVDRLAQDLGSLAAVLHTREFKLAGGEPLQHAEILRIVDVVRASSVADRITLITNGVLLDRAPEALWRKIDHMWVSVYPGVERGLSEEEIMARGREYGVTIRYKVTGAFDRRMLNARNTDAGLVDRIYSTCYQTRGCHSLYGGRYFKCASGPMIPRWLETAGTRAGGFEQDGVLVRDNPDLGRELESYLASPSPLEACNYCLGGAGKSAPHHQLNEAGVREWLGEDHSDAGTLVDWERLASLLEQKERSGSVVSRVIGALGRRSAFSPDE